MKAKNIGLAVCVALGIAGMANGAPIAWTSDVAATEGGYGQYLSPGLFDTNGAPLLAENAGGSAETFDGINFAEGTITFAGGTANNFHEKTELSKTGTFGTTGPDTVTLTGLTIGTNYVIQALIFDGRNANVEPTAPGRTIEVDGIDMGQYASGENNVTWGDGVLLSGTFTADATTQAFTLEAFNGGTSYGGQLNALTVFNPNGSVEPPPPAPPVWDDPIVVSGGLVGEPYSDTLDGKATDPNGDSITFSLAASTPDWLGVASDGAISNIRALVTGDVGTNDFNVVADDGVSGSTTGLLQIVVESASTITWTGEIATADTLGNLEAGLFNTNGILVLAENLGGEAVTFDGINFAAGTLTMGLVIADAYADNTDQINHSATYKWPAPPANLTLTGLTVGQAYRIQGLVYDGRTALSGRTVEFDGTDLGQYSFGTAGDYGDGLLATGTFVASAETQDFLVELFSPSSQGSQLNAITLHEVDPSLGGPVFIYYDGMELSWTGVVGYTYTVQTNGNLTLAESWGMYTNNIPGTGSLTTITPDKVEDQLFYRVITD